MNPSAQSGDAIDRFVQNVAVMGCMKYFIAIFNVAFWVSGLIVLFSGIWLQVELQTYLQLNIDLYEGMPYIFIGTGAMILFIGTLVCFCSLKDQPSLLYLYGGFLAVIFILEITLVASIYAYKDQMQDGFEHGLTRALVTYGLDTTKTNDIDHIQEKLKCCGNHGFEEWNTLTPPRPVAKSCCRTPHCDVEESDQIYTDGCYDKVIELVSQNMSIIGAAALAVTVLPIIGIVISWCLVSIANPSKYEQMN